MGKTMTKLHFPSLFPLQAVRNSKKRLNYSW